MKETDTTREQNVSGKDTLDIQKGKMGDQKGDGLSNSAMKIPLTGPEHSVCLRLEKQNCA